jgi:hypothetical protein
MFVPFVILTALPAYVMALDDARYSAAPLLAVRIDAALQAHWQAEQAVPAAMSDDAAFLRRITLDLAGRIPTMSEAQKFAAEPLADKRFRAIRRLMSSPDHALHLGRVLDEMIQDKRAGDRDFLEYLRDSAAQHKPWDQIFREVMIGPWDTKERKRADRFLTRRIQSLDDLTNDTARAFFGVNVSCAKCHDHPLVPDWKQDHYYGMASFFNRTQGQRGGEVKEKADGDVQFVTTKGERKTAKVMFLSGRIAETEAKQSRREKLVQVSLEERHFFSRAIVNRLWAYLLGRGLVQPVDQMHSANPPAVAGLLEWLADDFADHGYDLDRLIAGITSSRAYQLASVPRSDDAAGTHFAAARLKPLTPQQYALSILLATGDGSFDQPDARARRYRELEDRAGALTRLDQFDPRTDRFQSSATEALFLSNNPEAQRLVAKNGNNLVARLTALKDGGQIVDTAVWTVLSRPPDAEERSILTRWLDEHGPDRSKACGQLVWALLTSAEFRFNH